MDTSDLLRAAQALADSGRRDAELLDLCERLLVDDALPGSAYGRVAVWHSEALLGTGDLTGAVRAAVEAGALELPTAQRRALERVALTARNRAAGRVPLPRPILTPPPRPAATATKRAPAKRATVRRTTTKTAASRVPATSNALELLITAPAPGEEQIATAAAGIDARTLASVAVRLREAGRAGVAAELARAAFAQQAELADAPVAVVALASALADDGRRGEAAAVLAPLLEVGPDGLTTDRFLLSAGLRIVEDDGLAERIRARLEAG